MLLILLDNAVNFSDPGGAVEFTLRRKAEGFAVGATDHGHGIPLEELLHIFDRFWHTGGGGNRSGTGLGLTITRQIAGRHGAQIHAERARPALLCSCQPRSQQDIKTGRGIDAATANSLKPMSPKRHLRQRSDPLTTAA